MDGKIYLSVKEFAKLAGITEQAVYKQLNNKLEPYVHEIDNKKMLDKAGLELFAVRMSPVEQRLFNQLEMELEQRDEMIRTLQEERLRCLKLLDEEKLRYQKMLEEERQERKESNQMRRELEKQLLEQTLQKESAQQFVQQFTNLLKTELETKRERISTLELQVQKKQWWKFWERRAEE